jgi:hypothetical protein
MCPLAVSERFKWFDDSSRFVGGAFEVCVPRVLYYQEIGAKHAGRPVRSTKLRISQTFDAKKYATEEKLVLPKEATTPSSR